MYVYVYVLGNSVVCAALVCSICIPLYFESATNTLNARNKNNMQSIVNCGVAYSLREKFSLWTKPCGFLFVFYWMVWVNIFRQVSVICERSERNLTEGVSSPSSRKRHFVNVSHVPGIKYIPLAVENTTIGYHHACSRRLSNEGPGKILRGIAYP